MENHTKYCIYLYFADVKNKKLNMKIVSISLTKVYLDSQGVHIVIPAYIPEEFFFIIDTGASKSVIDSGIIASIPHTIIQTENIESSHISGMIGGEIISIPSLTIGNVVCEHFEALAMPLDHIQGLYSQFFPGKICGLLGGDFLQKYKATISFTRNTITLRVN